MYHITFPQQSNAASWPLVGLITDLDDNPLDLTGMSLVFNIVDKNGASVLQASTANGKITIVDVGMFRWFFTLADMQSLCANTYQTGLTLTTADQSQTVQLTVGPLPIISGNMASTGTPFGPDYP
jgi:hypothetical protein